MPAWMPAALGLGAAGLWGTADFFAKRVAERDGAETALFWLYLIGVPVFIAVAVAAGGPLPAPRGAAIWLAAGILNAGAYLLLYRGFRVGLLSVVTTTNASWAAITVILAAVFVGEAPSPGAWAGIAITLAGVVLVANPGGGFRLGAPGFKEGAGAAVFFGTSFFLLRLPAAGGDPFVQSAVLRVVGLVVVGLRLVSLKADFRRFLRRPPLFGFLDSAGFLCFVGGLSLGAPYVVAPLGSLLTPVAVALSAIFYHERLQPHQWAGFFLTVTGAVWLA